MSSLSWRCHEQGAVTRTWGSGSNNFNISELEFSDDWLRILLLKDKLCIADIMNNWIILIEGKAENWGLSFPGQDFIEVLISGIKSVGLLYEWEFLFMLRWVRFVLKVCIERFVIKLLNLYSFFWQKVKTVSRIFKGLRPSPSLKSKPRNGNLNTALLF